MVRTAREPADYILPLYMNGLSGRMLRMPAPKHKKREIMLVYGHHAVLERWWGLAENLNQYGSVTMPDLPGFGGMDAFGKIGVYPDIDAYADYLASFVKLRYKRRKFTLVAVSFGFIVVTRMLQRYPEIADKVDVLVSIVGFMHKDDFVFNKHNQRIFRVIARMFATRPVAFFIRYAMLNRFILKNLYARFPNSRRRMLEVTPDEFDESMDFETKLWQANDVRTHWLTTSEFLGLDNCQAHVSLQVIHVVSEQDHYLNNITVEQHMRQVFSDYMQFTARSKSHVPSIIADKRAMAVLLPPGLRKLLNRAPKRN